jgi:curli biogenesis system outer membrane secretion channel CsgG
MFNLELIVSVFCLTKEYFGVRIQKSAIIERRGKMGKTFIYRSVVVLSFLAFMLLQGCATVQKADIQQVPVEKPQVSKAISAEQTGTRYLKRKVAIARFSNETVYGQGFWIDENKDRIGKQASDILSAKLAATDRFILLERTDIDKINRELGLGNLSNLNIPADYLIIGSVSEFGRKTVSDVGVFSRVKKQEARAKVNIRLVDVRTGQIVYSEEGEGEAFSEAGTVLGVGSRAEYDSTLNEKAIGAAIAKLTSNVIENLLHNPWRSYILSYENNSYIIAGGKSQGVRVNDSFGVYKRGKAVRNPQTGMMVELPAQLIGKIKVISFMGSDPNNELSLCTVEAGDIPKTGFEEYYIQEL